MNDSDIFRSPSEELEKLTTEIAEIKSLLKDITARLNQIERHAARAFKPVSTAQQPKRPQRNTEEIDRYSSPLLS